MRKYLDYTGLQTLVERIKSCYLLEIGVSGGAGAIIVDSTADQAEINAIVEGNAPMPIAVKLHMADNDTDYIVNTCQVRGGYFMLYIPDDMVLTDIDGTEFTGTWMTFMDDRFFAAVDYYATSVDLRNSTQVITDTSKATSSNVLYLVADSNKNVTGVVYNKKTYSFAAEKGEKGDKGDTGATGVGITSVKQTVASMISGDTNVVEITTSDGKTSQVKIRNGNASTSGTEIVQTTGQATDKVMSQKSVTDALQNKLDKAAFDSIDPHPATYFNGFVSNIDAARYPKSCPFGLKQFSVVFDRRYTSDLIFREGYKVFELNGVNAANDYLYLRINGWQIDFHARKSGGTAYNSKYLGSLSSQGTDHVILTFDLETGEIKAYYSGELAWTDQLNDWDFDTYYPSNCKTYSLNPAVVSGKLGCALLNYCISDDDAAKLYQAGCYFDNFMPATYVCYDKDVRKLTSYDKIGRNYSNSITLSAENGAIRIECSKTNNNEYLVYDNFTASRDAVKMMRYTAHIKVISGDSFKFVGFGINGRFVAKIYDSSDGSLYCEGAAKALLAGHEYDLQFVGVPNAAGHCLLNFSHGDSGVCVVSDITVTNLGAFLLCAPQNYVGSRFKQGNGEILNLNGGEAFYDLYKPRIVSTKGYPQFNGQLCITPADGKVYIAVRTAKGYTWKQINNT